MNKKRILNFGILGLFLFSMMAGVLGANLTQEGKEIAETTVTFWSGLFNELLAPLFGDQEMLSRVFFALLLGMIIYSIISTIFEKSSNWVQWGITFAIVSLSLVGLPVNFLESVRTQYGAMGAAILTAIPFMIVLMFSIKSKNLIVARVTWIFYAFYYFALYLYNFAQEKIWLTSENIPYLVAFFAGGLVFFLIPQIRKLVLGAEVEGLIEKGMEKVKKRAAARKVSDANLTAETGIGV